MAKNNYIPDQPVSILQLRDLEARNILPQLVSEYRHVLDDEKANKKAKEMYKETIKEIDNRVALPDKLDCGTGILQRRTRVYESIDPLLLLKHGVSMQQIEDSTVRNTTEFWVVLKPGEKGD